MPPLELNFLTEDASLIELARLYWELDQEETGFPHQIKELALSFSLPANQILKIVLQNCVASSPSIACETCGRAKHYKSRSNYLEAQRHYRHYGSWQCWDCIREEERRQRDEERKRQELAQQHADELRQHRTRLIEKAYARREDPDFLLPTELSFESVVYLLGSMRAGGPVCSLDVFESGAEDYDKADDFSPRIIKGISPTKAFDEEILDRLKSRHLIAVSPMSEPEAFEFDQDQIVGYDSEKVIWEILPDVPEDQRLSFIQQVEDRLKRREHKTWHEGWPRVWKKIAVAECVQFLVCSIERYRFSYTPDMQATDLFSNLVDSYSLAQVFYLINKATKDFANFARQQRWPMRASRVVEKIRDNESYYRSQGWTIYSFRQRPAFPQQSVISIFFFDTVLGIGDNGFFKAAKEIDSSKIDDESVAELNCEEE